MMRYTKRAFSMYQSTYMYRPINIVSVEVVSGISLICDL